MRKRRILLIGAGGWGAVHLDAYRHHKSWTVSSLADADAGLLRRLSDECNIPESRCFSDPMRAIEAGEYDAISVVVRNPRRVPILLRALGTGAPVFVEKPLVHTPADLRKVCAAARKSGSTLMVSQNYRFEPQARRMAEFVRARRSWGRLNTMLVDFSRNIRELGNHPVTRLPEGIGLGAEMCVHHYDLMRFLVGAEPVRVRAQARRAPDSAMRGWATIEAWIEFPDSVFVNYHATYDAPVSRTPWGGEWTLDFAGGSLSWFPYSNNERPIDYHSPWRGRWRLEPRLTRPERLYKHHLVGTAFDEFTRALDEERRPECDLADNARTLALMWAIERSAKTGREVDFQRFQKEVLRGCQ